ncbi:MAG: hypothetical protein V4560_15220 [Bacteroidota bacterium]
MKTLILTCCLFISLAAQSQDKKIKLDGVHQSATAVAETVDSTYKITNPNGSYALVEKTGDKTTSTTKFSVVNNGKTSVITNPDGSKSTVVNDPVTGSVYATDGSPSTNVRVITDAEVKAIEAGTPKIFTTTNADGSITRGMNIVTAKPVSTYSTLSTTTTGTPEMTLAEKAMANYWVRPAVKYAVVANESFDGVGKFELDLLSDIKDVKKSTDYIWLSIGTGSTKELSSGVYNYSTKSINDRGTFTFSGAVINGKEQIEFTDGSFTVNIDKSVINVEYNLSLKNGKRISGRYTGKYETGDWSKNK